MDEIERYIIRSAVFVLVLLVLVQGLMTNDSIRFYLSLGEHLEGKKVEVPAASIKDRSADLQKASSPGIGSITIEVVDYTGLDQALLLINGHKAGDFSEGRLTAAVASGDVLEIDATRYSHPIQFRVETVSSGIKFPTQGQMTETDRSMALIGKIEFE